MSDKTRLLALFRQSNGRLITSSEMIDGRFDNGKRIIEYTGRLKDARDEMGCTCGEDPKKCLGSEHIVNVRTNFYQYQTTRPVVEEVIPTLEIEKPDYEKQRKALAKKYLAETDPFKKEAIKQAGLAVRALINKQIEDKKLERNIVEALL